MPVQAPTFSESTPQIDQAYQDKADLVSQNDQSLAPLRSQRQEMTSEFMTEARRPMPTPPTLGALPTYQPKEFTQNDAMTFGSMATAFSALAGLLTRQPLTAAMNSAGRAMMGFQEGRYAQINNDLQQFRTLSANAVAQNRQMLDQYETILQDHRLTMAQKSSMLQVATAQHKDAIGEAMMREGRQDKFIDALERRKQAHDTFEEKRYEFERALEAKAMEGAAQRGMLLEVAKLRAGAKGGEQATDLDENMKNMLAERWMAGDSTALSGFGYGKAAVEMRRQILERATELATNRGITGGDLSAIGAERKATQTNMQQYGNYVNRLEALGGKIDRDINVMFQVAGRGVGPTGVPVFDQWVQAGRRRTGDPDVTAFDVAIQTLKNEYGRSMSGPASNAQLHVAAMEHADQLINTSMTLPQIKSAVKLMRADIENARVQARTQWQEMRTRTSELGQQPPGGRRGPAVGTVENGYRFKGGNPGQQSSWEPVTVEPEAGHAQ